VATLPLKNVTVFWAGVAEKPFPKISMVSPTFPPFGETSVIPTAPGMLLASVRVMESKLPLASQFQETAVPSAAIIPMSSLLAL
jgi:hypothetical protein